MNKINSVFTLIFGLVFLLGFNVKNNMVVDKDMIVSAQTVLKSASGISINSNTIITTKTIQDYQPDQDTVTSVSKILTQEGFEVGSLVGTNFSITGSVGLFENFFGIKLKQSEKSGIQILLDNGSSSYKIPTKAFPVSIASAIVSISFSPPPSFFVPSNF